MMARWAAGIILTIAVTSCRLGDLVGPLPQYVQGCTRYQDVTLTVGGQSQTYSVCLERGWVRKVDTIPWQPRIP